MRIMGKIEYDVRTILKIADVPDDQTLLYLACAREFYADYENCKGDKLEPALVNTMTKWVERGYKSDIIKRIRNRVTEVYSTLKNQKKTAPKPAPDPQTPPQPEIEPELTEEADTGNLP
jgi:hypothetical protein